MKTINRFVETSFRDSDTKFILRSHSDAVDLNFIRHKHTRKKRKKKKPRQRIKYACSISYCT